MDYLQIPEWQQYLTESEPFIVKLKKKWDDWLEKWEPIVPKPPPIDPKQIHKYNIAVDNFNRPDFSSESCKNYPIYFDIVNRMIAKLFLENQSMIIFDRHGSLLSLYVGSLRSFSINKTLYDDYRDQQTRQMHTELGLHYSEQKDESWTEHVQFLNHLIQQCDPVRNSFVGWRVIKDVEFKWWKFGSNALQETTWPAFTSITTRLQQSIDIFARGKSTDRCLFRIHVPVGVRVLPGGALNHIQNAMGANIIERIYDAKSKPGTDSLWVTQEEESEFILEPGMSCFINWDSFHALPYKRYGEWKCIRVFDVYITGPAPKKDPVDPVVSGRNLKPWMCPDVLIHTRYGKAKIVQVTDANELHVLVKDTIHIIPLAEQDRIGPVALKKGATCMVVCGKYRGQKGIVLDVFKIQTHCAIKLIESNKILVYYYNQVYCCE